MIMDTNWLYVGLTAFAVYASVFGYFVAKRRWTRAGLAVGVTNMLFVVLNLAAPFRGAFDPGYAGYSVGLIRLEPGIGVTVVTGLIIVLALASACIAVLNRVGKPMWVVVLVDTALLLLIGLPEAVAVLADPASYRIELGEYLQIPGLVAGLIVLVLFVVPLIASVLWSARRTREPHLDDLPTGAGVSTLHEHPSS